MAEVASFLKAHRAVVAMQKGYTPAPASTRNYALFFLLFSRYIGPRGGGGTKAVIIGIFVANLVCLFQGRTLLQTLVTRVNNLITSHDNLSQQVKTLKDEFNECTKSLIGQVEKIDTHTEEIKKITEVITSLTEGMNSLFKAQQEERNELCSLFNQIRQENAETKEAIDQQLEEMKDTSRKIGAALRELFSPLSAFSERLKYTGNEMDHLASIIEKILSE